MGRDRPAPARPAEQTVAPAELPRLGHIATLDGLRGIAILLVMCDRFRFIEHPATFAGKLFLFVTGFGWMGVQLFFVLSGFLITRILLETRAAPNYYRAFFTRRVLRIFPLYYTVVFVGCVLLPVAFSWGQPDIVLPAHQLWSWTYLQNWTEPFGRIVPFFPHFWSLGVEEQFYLLWPAVVRVCGAARLPRVCLALVGVALVARGVIRWIDRPWSADACYMFTVCRMDALAVGALVALLPEYPRAERFLGQHLRAVVAAAAVLLGGGAVLTDAYDRTGLGGQTIGYSVLAFEFGLMLWLALRSSVWPPVGQTAPGEASPARVPARVRGRVLGRVLDSAPLVSVGKYSYAMYVLHVPLHEFVGRPLLTRFGIGSGAGAAANLAYLVGATLVTYAAANLSYHLLEKHFLQMKRYFVAAPAPVPAGAALARS